MAKNSYKVTVIRKGMEGDYHDFWLRNVHINASGEVLHSAKLAFTVTIEAKNLKEALSIARSDHPDLTVDAEASSKIG